MKQNPQKYDHLGDTLNDNLLQFYDFPEDDENTIANDLASIDKRYSDFTLIAEGGTKRVYKAMDNVVKRQIAYARLIDNEKDNHESFLREARLCSLLQHPGIISVLDMGLEEEKPFFTMELKVGHSLGFILKKIARGNQDYIENYPLEKLLSIFIKICDAVAYAHSLEIVHLDIKPDNVQVGEFGEVVVCDWGLGKLISKEDLPGAQYENLLKIQTTSDLIKGTPGFMAPEQILPDENITEAADIYALGALLYNILTNKVPIKDKLEEVLKKTLTGDIKEPIAENSKTPESLNAVTMKALETFPRDRYRTVHDLKIEVEKYLSGFATNAEQASFTKQVYLFYQRHKILCTTISLAILIYIISSMLFISKINQEKNEAVKQKKKAELAEAEAFRAFTNEQIARKDAELARQEAFRAFANEQNIRKDAEENLRMYQEEKEHSNKLIHEKLNRSKVFIKYSMYDPAVDIISFYVEKKSLEKLNKRQPQNTEVQKTLGYLYFIMQKYTLAEKFLEESESHKDLVITLKEFHKDVEYKQKYNTEDTTKLIKLIYQKKIENAFRVITEIMRYQALLLPSDLDSLIYEVMKVFNGEDLVFKLNKEKAFLEIGSPEKKIIFSYRDYNFFRCFDVPHLKINGRANNIRTLKQTRIQILDITEADINTKELEYLKQIFTLKVLYVRKEQLNDNLVSQLRNSIEIIEK